MANPNIDNETMLALALNFIKGFEAKQEESLRENPNAAALGYLEITLALRISETFFRSRHPDVCRDFDVYWKRIEPMAKAVLASIRFEEAGKKPGERL